MELMEAKHASEILVHVADRIIDSKPYLTKVDSDIGDGDHGIGMELGMKKGLAKIQDMTAEQNVYMLFETFGKAMMMSMGGASGIIFGSVFMAGAKGMEPKFAITAGEFADMFRHSLDEVKSRGGAHVGDKTMVDAFEPAVIALQKNADRGFEEMLRAASEAAKAGAEKTKDYVAKFGRAKSLLERAVGHMDAGAVSTGIIFEAMYEYVRS